MSESHSILDDKVHVYLRPGSQVWQCSTYLGSRNHRKSTGYTKLTDALAFAKDWYLDRLSDDRAQKKTDAAGAATSPVRKARAKGPAKAGELTFREASAVFLTEYEALTDGERNAVYVASIKQKLRLYINPILGHLPLSQVTSGVVQQYRVYRVTAPTTPPEPRRYKRAGREWKGAPLKWRKPSRSTLQKEIVCLRQVLKTANRHGWISALPDLSTPYRVSGKVSHRAWFSPEDYKRLYEATRERARNPIRERWRAECEHLHDWVLFMGNTGLRPDEASRLQFRDVKVEVNKETKEAILLIEVRGKRGVGYCKSMPGAVLPFQRVEKRKGGKSSDLVFGKVQRELFNSVLGELGLKFDRDGRVRTAYSLRHTYICLRLMAGADIYQVAKNCRTSVEMIEKHYAAHIANTLDASAINVRRA